MTRDDVLELIRAHLADELQLDPARITESTHFRDDLAADSLDLYPLVQELEDPYGAGRLTKVRAQAVSGRSCRDVAERLGIPERLRTATPDEFAGPATEQLARTERVLASVIEAVIGACYLEFGYDEVADAVVEAF